MKMMDSFSIGLKITLATCLGMAALSQALRGEDLKVRGIVDFGGVQMGEIFSYSQILTDLQDGDELGYYRLTQKFNYKASDTWTLGAHPVWHHLKSGVSDEWKDYYAIDFEANPKWRVTDRVSLALRNRLALIWKEGLGEDPLVRIRQRTKLSWKLPNKPLGFTAFSVANEIFWEDDRDMITRNRIYPASLSFSPKANIRSSISYGYFSKRIDRSNDWKGMHVIQLFTRF